MILGDQADGLGQRAAAHHPDGHPVRPLRRQGGGGHRLRRGGRGRHLRGQRRSAKLSIVIVYIVIVAVL